MSNWISVRIGELATYINGRGFKPTEWSTKGLPIVRIANLNDPKAPYDYFNGDLDDGHRIDDSDILVSWSATLDAFIWERGPAALNQHIFKVVPNEQLVDQDFLFFVLKEAMKGLFDLVHGATMKHVTRPMFEGYEVRILSEKDDQRRIAAGLKAQVAEVEKARLAAEVQLRDAIYFANLHRDSTLEQLDYAPRVALGELLKGIEAGKSFKTSELPARPEQLGVLKVSAVSWNKFQPQEAKVIEGDYQPDDRHRVKKGDLIISRANTKELVGAVVMTSKDYPLRLLSDKTLRLLVDEERVLPTYLLNVLKWPEARAYIENNATGTSDSMRNISQKTICKIPIPLIPKEIQKNIIERFNAVAEEVRSIEVAIKKVNSDINKLPQKILAHTFEMK